MPSPPSKNPLTPPSLEGLLERRWDADFIIDPSRPAPLTTAEFFHRVEVCSRILREAGLKPDARLAVILPNSLLMPVLYFACVLNGWTYVPIDPQKGEQGIADIMSLFEADAMVESVGVCGNAPRINPQRLLAALDEPAQTLPWQDFRQTWLAADLDRVSLITFTSGSTGLPKGVCHSFSNLAGSALAFNAFFDFQPSHRFYHNLPMSYMAGILNLMLLPFLAGSQVILGERFSIGGVSRFWEQPIRYGANAFWFNPTIVSLLLKLDRGEAGVNYASQTPIVGCVGTAPLSEAQKQRFEARYNLPLYESYGLSETLFNASNAPLHPHAENSVGRLLPGVNMRLDEDGEILLDVPWMFKGYLNHQTETYFSEGRYRSGDLGRLDEQGRLFITGRKKDLIIRGGVNLSPRRIEDFVLSSGLFSDELVVYGLPDEVMGEKTACAYVSGSLDDPRHFEKRLNLALTQQLGADYKIDVFMPMESLPKNSNGKIDKPALQALSRQSALP